jgi:hypothetical protein
MAIEMGGDVAPDTKWFRPRWACQWQHDTAEKAITETCERERRMYEPIMKFVDEATAAISSGQTLEPFLNGIEE